MDPDLADAFTHRLDVPKVAVFNPLDTRKDLGRGPPVFQRIDPMVEFGT